MYIYSSSSLRDLSEGDYTSFQAASNQLLRLTSSALSSRVYTSHAAHQAYIARMPCSGAYLKGTSFCKTVPPIFTDASSSGNTRVLHGDFGLRMNAHLERPSRRLSHRHQHSIFFSLYCALVDSIHLLLCIVWYHCVLMCCIYDCISKGTHKETCVCLLSPNVEDKAITLVRMPGARRP